MMIELQKIINKWQSEDAVLTVTISNGDLTQSEYGKLRIAQRRLRLCIHDLTLLLNSENEKTGEEDGK